LPAAAGFCKADEGGGGVSSAFAGLFCAAFCLLRRPLWCPLGARFDTLRAWSARLSPAIVACYNLRLSRSPTFCFAFNGCGNQRVKVTNGNQRVTNAIKAIRKVARQAANSQAGAPRVSAASIFEMSIYGIAPRIRQPA